MNQIKFILKVIVTIAVTLVAIGTTTLMAMNIAPNLWSGIVISSLVALLVLLSLEALTEKRLVFWWIMAAMIVFSDVSTFLTITESKTTELAVAVDPAQTRLQAATDKAQGVLDDLLRQQGAAQNRATLDAIASQIKGAQDRLERAQADERNYHAAEEGRGLDPRRLFSAIPNAVTSGSLDRWMTFIFAAIMACALQAGMFTATAATMKALKKNDRQAATKPKRRPRRTKAEMVAARAEEVLEAPLEQPQQEETA